MAKIKNVEKKIWDTDGFDVVIKQNGRDIRGDKIVPVNYNSYQKAAKNDMTVTEWKDKRFNTTFPGYEVDVLDGNGNIVNGNMKLGTVRDSYLEE
jgi:hypothetical protein